MEKVLVRGGAGYIGCVLSTMLLEQGYHVTIYDNFMYGAQQLCCLSKHPHVEFVKGDIRDADHLGHVIKGQDWVFHLAAIVGYPACAADPYRATTTNVDGTRIVLEGMERGQRLIFASTGSTYGKVIGTATEETPIAPLTLYGKNKRDCEKMIRMSDIPHSILRFATVFGSSPRLRLDLLINDFVYQALHNKQIVLFEGHFRRTFLHSTDAAAVYPFAMDHFEEMIGNVYNVGDESMNYTKRQVAYKIREYVNYYLHEADVGTDPDQRDYEVDYSRLKRLGYSAKVTLDEGLRELIKIFSVLSIQHQLRNN